MRLMTSIRLRKYAIRSGIFLGILILWYKWMTREPTMPDEPLLLSEVSAMDFFEERLKGDGLNFTWSHATNSINKLLTATRAGVCGIEADVILKGEGTSEVEQLPIMAHPPDFRSDLTLRIFLHETILGNSLIKLDFKTDLSVEISLQIIGELADSIKVPVWLNADILQGPGAAPPPSISAKSFLNKISSGFRYCTLSLGWTTSQYQRVPYSWPNVYEMYNTIRPTVISSRKVTFPINASLLKSSVVPLHWLCEQFDASLTIWQSSDDHPVDISELVYLRSKFPKSRVYYDLQPNTMKKFLKVANEADSLTQAHRTREANAVDTSAWVITMSNQQSSDLKLGEDVIWLSGSQAQLKSRVVVSGRRSFLIRGAVSFIPINGSDSYRSSLQIYLYGKEHVTNHPSGIRCSINNAGRMMVAADHMKDASLYMDKEVGSSTSSCYQFELKVSGLEIEFSASAPKFDCHIMQDLVKPQTIKTVLVAKGLTDPFRLIMRNGASEGYAILEQFKLTSL